MERLDVFRGSADAATESGNAVIALVLLTAPRDGLVEVGERRYTDGEKEYSEYLKPVSEVSREVENGLLTRTGKTAKSAAAARDTLALE